MIKKNKAILLTYSGTVPFLWALFMAFYACFEFQNFFNFEIRFARFKSYMIAHTYGAVIVAFLGGIQWGLSLNERTDRQYFVISNILALMAWASLFAFASFVGLLVILLAFLLALAVDHHAYQAGLISKWFWHLRIRVSSVVIVTMSLLLLINQ